jgi:hypothetical protein
VVATAGDAAASVTWVAPTDTGTAAVTGYTVTSTPGNIAVTTSGTVTTAAFTGLTNGTSYTFVVTATNSVGVGEASAASNAVTPVAGTPAPVAPSAPHSVSATAGNAQATVKWQAPASVGTSAIVSYTVVSTPGNRTATVSAPALTAVVAGLTNGTSYTFVVTAKNATSTSTPSAASNAVTPEAPVTPPTNGAWTFCTNAGAMCNFLGLRDVRLADPTGTKSVVQEAFRSVPCAVYGFSNQNPAPNQALHCDFGPAKTTTLQNPSPGMAGMPASVLAPMGDPGAPGPQSRKNGSGNGTFGDFGAFRMQCNLAKFAFDDPIVAPGQPGGSHLHMFFGNTAVDAFSTPQSIATTGNSTCAGGTLNRTGYWMPAIFDTRTGNVVLPDVITVYYKTGLNADYTKIQPPPNGLRMIAGDKTWQGPGPQTEKPQGFQFIEWVCRDGAPASSNDEGSIPNCRAGDAVHLSIEFPQCWDGKNLDSPDHKSHMAQAIYAGSTRNGTKCPATHPVMIPQITEIFDFPVTEANAPNYWRLSSDMYALSKRGGYSAHADWMMGWDETTMKTMVTFCLNKGNDCGVNFIGNGTEIFR